MKKYFEITHLLTYSIIMGLVLIITSCQQNEELRVYEYPEPTVLGFTPSEGVIGTQVTITGSDFGTYKGAVTVYFNEVPTAKDQIISIADDKIVVEVPQGASTGTVSVKVWTHIKDLDGVFNVIPSATFDRIEPNAGKPGDELIIYGENFGNDESVISVNFKEDIEAEIVSVSDTEIKVIVPDGGVTGPISVKKGIESFQTTSFAYPLVGLNFMFDENGNSEGWQSSHNSTFEVSNGSMNVLFDPGQFGGTSKRRADFQLAGGATVNVGGFPILAIKIKKPKSGNFILDTNFGSYKNGSNNWDGVLYGDIYYYDLRNTFGASGNTLSLTEDTVFTTLQFKIADIVTAETGYSVDWIRSFESMNALKEYTKLPAGKYIFEFDGNREVKLDVYDDWVARPDQSAWTGPTATAVRDGYLKVTFASPSNGTNNNRADCTYSFGGDWGSPGSGIDKEPWVYSSEYPIYAIKVHWIQNDGSLGGPRPAIGNIFYDRLGQFNDDYVADNVLWLDATSWGGAGIKEEASWWQMKIADVKSNELGYWIDWHRTFKSREELEAFIAAN